MPLFEDILVAGGLAARDEALSRHRPTDVAIIICASTFVANSSLLPHVGDIPS